MHAATVNGAPGVVFLAGGTVIQVVSLCIEAGVRAVYMINNPDKLSLLGERPRSNRILSRRSA